MKKLNVILFSLLFGSALIAQESKGTKSPEERAAAMTQRLDEEVDLSDEQKQSIEKINNVYVLKIKEVKNNNDLEEEAKKEQIQTLKKEWKGLVKNELSEDQIERMKELRKEHRNKEELTPEERAEKRTDHLIKSLDLNSEQAEQVRELNMNTGASIHEIKTNNKLTKEEKRELIESKKEAFHNALKEILTPDQLEKFEALKKNHPEKTGKPE